MEKKRIPRLNSLLKEVLAEVIRGEVKDPRMAPLVTVTSVDISKDLHHAKVYVSIIGSDKEKRETLEALESAAGFIGVNAAKKVTMRYFPTLTFKLDTTVDEQMKIDALIEKIHREEDTRPHEN
ncbi:MAG: 30S ribosome-binding factor RbfA [Simkaniaceae bacterium]|nr:30S ribosome-binding factor RbfA [Candidatus Sacchlamyda saccharinae]